MIGKGNFAKVFLVERKKDRKEFAVKVFDKETIMKDELEKKCLLYEIKMMRNMDHPRVLKLHELYEGENYIYCLCELYKGSDLLKAIIKKGSQPEMKALSIVFQILEALAYMHSKKIIHRDLKPENIIFKTSKHDIDIGVVDLGFATFEKDYRKLFVRCGTPGYVAPEVLNDKDYNCKVDVYSAGIIFYIILTGHIPFYGNSYKEIVMRNMKGDINFNFSKYKIKVNEDTMDLLKSMLQKDPRKRISSADALMHPAFCNVLSKSPLHIKPIDQLNVDDLKQHTNITGEERTKTQKGKAKNPSTIPDDINDFYSPNTPAINKKRKKSFDAVKKGVNKMKVKK